MHCPSCGKPSTSEKYCRSCGMDLEPVGKLVTTHTGSDELRTNQADAENVALSLMIKWMMWGLLVLGIGVVLLLVHKTFLLDRLVGLIASFVMISGVGMASYGLFAAMRDGARLSNRTTAAKELPSGKTTASLPEERSAVPLPSVTERTTQLIPQNDVQSTRE